MTDEINKIRIEFINDNLEYIKKYAMVVNEIRLDVLKDFKIIAENKDIINLWNDFTGNLSNLECNDPKNLLTLLDDLSQINNTKISNFISLLHDITNSTKKLMSKYPKIKGFSKIINYNKNFENLIINTNNKYKSILIKLGTNKETFSMNEKYTSSIVINDSIISTKIISNPSNLLINAIEILNNLIKTISIMTLTDLPLTKISMENYDKNVDKFIGERLKYESSEFDDLLIKLKTEDGWTDLKKQIITVFKDLNYFKKYYTDLYKNFYSGVKIFDKKMYQLINNKTSMTTKSFTDSIIKIRRLLTINLDKMYEEIMEMDIKDMFTKNFKEFTKFKLDDENKEEDIRFFKVIESSNFSKFIKEYLKILVGVFKKEEIGPAILSISSSFESYVKYLFIKNYINGNVNENEYDVLLIDQILKSTNEIIIMLFQSLISPIIENPISIPTPGIYTAYTKISGGGLVDIPVESSIKKQDVNPKYVKTLIILKDIIETYNMISKKINKKLNIEDDSFDVLLTPGEGEFHELYKMIKFEQVYNNSDINKILYIYEPLWKKYGDKKIIQEYVYRVNKNFMLKSKYTKNENENSLLVKSRKQDRLEDELFAKYANEIIKTYNEYIFGLIDVDYNQKIDSIKRSYNMLTTKFENMKISERFPSLRDIMNKKENMITFNDDDISVIDTIGNSLEVLNAQRIRFIKNLKKMVKYINDSKSSYNFVEDKKVDDKEEEEEEEEEEKLKFNDSEIDLINVEPFQIKGGGDDKKLEMNSSLLSADDFEFDKKDYKIYKQEVDSKKLLKNMFRNPNKEKLKKHNEILFLLDDDKKKNYKNIIGKVFNYETYLNIILGLTKDIDFIKNNTFGKYRIPISPKFTYDNIYMIFVLELFRYKFDDYNIVGPLAQFAKLFIKEFKGQIKNKIIKINPSKFIDLIKINNIDIKLLKLFGMEEKWFNFANDLSNLKNSEIEYIIEINEKIKFINYTDLKRLLNSERIDDGDKSTTNNLYENIYIPLCCYLLYKNKMDKIIYTDPFYKRPFLKDPDNEKFTIKNTYSIKDIEVKDIQEELGKYKYNYILSLINSINTTISDVVNNFNKFNEINYKNLENLILNGLYNTITLINKNSKTIDEIDGKIDSKISDAINNIRITLNNNKESIEKIQSKNTKYETLFSEISDYLEKIDKDLWFKQEKSLIDEKEKTERQNTKERSKLVINFDETFVFNNKSSISIRLPYDSKFNEYNWWYDNNLDYIVMKNNIPVIHQLNQQEKPNVIYQFSNRKILNDFMEINKLLRYDVELNFDIDTELLKKYIPLNKTIKSDDVLISKEKALKIKLLRNLLVKYPILNNKYYSNILFSKILNKEEIDSFLNEKNISVLSFIFDTSIICNYIDTIYRCKKISKRDKEIILQSDKNIIIMNDKIYYKKGDTNEINIYNFDINADLCKNCDYDINQIDIDINKSKSDIEKLILTNIIKNYDNNKITEYIDKEPLLKLFVEKIDLVDGNKIINSIIKKQNNYDFKFDGIDVKINLNWITKNDKWYEKRINKYSDKQRNKYNNINYILNKLNNLYYDDDETKKIIDINALKILLANMKLKDETINEILNYKELTPDYLLPNLYNPIDNILKPYELDMSLLLSAFVDNDGQIIREIIEKNENIVIDYTPIDNYKEIIKYIIFSKGSKKCYDRIKDVSLIKNLKKIRKVLFDMTLIDAFDNLDDIYKSDITNLIKINDIYYKINFIEKSVNRIGKSIKKETFVNIHGGNYDVDMKNIYDTVSPPKMSEPQVRQITIPEINENNLINIIPLSNENEFFTCLFNFITANKMVDVDNNGLNIVEYINYVKDFTLSIKNIISVLNTKYSLKPIIDELEKSAFFKNSYIQKIRKYLYYINYYNNEYIDNINKYVEYINYYIVKSKSTDILNYIKIPKITNYKDHNPFDYSFLLDGSKKNTVAILNPYDEEDEKVIKNINENSDIIYSKNRERNISVARSYNYLITKLLNMMYSGQDSKSVDSTFIEDLYLSLNKFNVKSSKKMTIKSIGNSHPRINVKKDGIIFDNGGISTIEFYDNAYTIPDYKFEFDGINPNINSYSSPLNDIERYLPNTIKNLFVGTWDVKDYLIGTLDIDGVNPNDTYLLYSNTLLLIENMRNKSYQFSEMLENELVKLKLNLPIFISLFKKLYKFTFILKIMHGTYNEHINDMLQLIDSACKNCERMNSRVKKSIPDLDKMKFLQTLGEYRHNSETKNENVNTLFTIYNYLINSSPIVPRSGIKLIDLQRSYPMVNMLINNDINSLQISNFSYIVEGLKKVEIKDKDIKSILYNTILGYNYLNEFNFENLISNKKNITKHNEFYKLIVRDKLPDIENPLDMIYERKDLAKLFKFRNFVQDKNEYIRNNYNKLENERLGLPIFERLVQFIDKFYNIANKSTSVILDSTIYVPLIINKPLIDFTLIYNRLGFMTIALMSSLYDITKIKFITQKPKLIEGISIPTNISGAGKFKLDNIDNISSINDKLNKIMKERLDELKLILDKFNVVLKTKTKVKEDIFKDDFDELDI